MSTTNPRRLVYVSIDELTPADRNARLHDLPDLQAKMERFGFLDPIVVDERTGKIVGGHGRMETLQQARAAGLEAPEGIKVTKAGWFVPTMQGWSSKNDLEADAANLALNPSPNDPGFNQELLAEILGGLAKADQLEGTGHNEQSLEALLEELNGPAPLPEFDHDPDEDDIEPKVEPISALGDRWVCGDHVVVCGDSTKHETYELLLAGDEASMVWTDPPYGVDYVGKTKDALTIVNDGTDLDALELLLRSALSLTMANTVKGSVWHVAAPPGPASLAFSTVLTELGVWRQCYAWVKDVFVLGHSDLHYRHETLYYGWTPGAAHQAPAERTWDTVWEIPRPKRSTEHPTMKPVELVERAVLLSSKAGALVLDPFGGSGTTLLACHRAGRQARLIEKDPRYVDVICRRYQALSGQKPRRGRKAVDFA